MKRRYRTKIAANAGKRFILPQSSALSAETAYDDFIAAVDDNSINVGDLIVYNPHTGAVYTALAPLAAGDIFAVAQSLGNGEVHFTHPITYKPKCLSARDLAQGDPHTITYTVTSAATEKGQEFEITVSDNTENIINNVLDRLEFVSVTGAETAAQIAAGIKDLFDAKADNPQYNSLSDFYTLTVAGAVLTFTAKDKGIQIGVNGTSDDITGTIAETVAFTPLIGDGEQVYFEELAGSAYEGLGSNYSKREFQPYVGDPVPFSKKTCTYDAITIIDMKEWDSIGGVPQVQNFKNQTVIFIESETVGTSGSSSYTDLKTIFGL